eukprot:scaffold23348_cov57-Phaeocystis_antarctica.AAC.2
MASRWSSMRSEIRSEMWPLRASPRMVAWHQPRTISGRRRTLASSSFSLRVSTSPGTRSRSWFIRQSCINSAKKRRSMRCKRSMASSASGVPGRISVLKTMRRISERLWLRTAPTCPRACQERARTLVRLGVGSCSHTYSLPLAHLPEARVGHVRLEDDEERQARSEDHEVKGADVLQLVVGSHVVHHVVELPQRRGDDRPYENRLAEHRRAADGEHGRHASRTLEALSDVDVAGPRPGVFGPRHRA